MFVCLFALFVFIACDWLPAEALASTLLSFESRVNISAWDKRGCRGLCILQCPPTPFKMLFVTDFVLVSHAADDECDDMNSDGNSEGMSTCANVSKTPVWL